MKLRRTAFFLPLILLAAPAYAEKLPEEVLARDYQNCLGNDSNPSRAAYCACVRDGMHGWDLDVYMQMAMQMAAEAGSSDAPQVPDKIEALAKQCFAQAFH